MKNSPLVRVVADPKPSLTFCDGSPIHGVGSADIELRPGQIAKVKMQLLSTAVDIQGHPEFYLTHPVTGKSTRVRSIEFVDAPVFRDATCPVTR